MWYSVGGVVSRIPYAGNASLGGMSVQDTICIGDGLVLKARPNGLYILLRRKGEADAARIYLNEVRHLADALREMAAEVAGLVTDDEELGSDSGPGR